MRCLLLLLALFTLVEPGVFDVPLQCAPAREGEYRQALRQAQRRLHAFASRHGWQSEMATPLVEQAEFFESKEDYDRFLYQLFPEQAGKPIPATYVAGTQNNRLFSVSPEVLERNAPSNDPLAFEKLLTHELAHVLHVRLCRGDESKMGPIWFWEGFAVLAADQYPTDDTRLSEDELWQIVASEQRASYKKYRFIMRHFLTLTDLPELLRRSQQPQFEHWLRSL